MISIVTNAVLIIFGTLSAVIGLRFWKMRNQLFQKRLALTGMAVSVCLWCFNYGLMGMTENLDVALRFRQIGLGGVYAFLVCEEIFLMYSCPQIGELARKIMHVLSTMAGIVSFIFASNKNTIDLVRYNGRTSFYDRVALGNYFDRYFLIGSFVFLAILGILWYRSVNLKRQRAIVKIVYVANLILVLCAIPDSVVTQMGYPAYPSSGMGGFLALALIWYFIDRSTAFNISVENLGKYIYQLADTNLLVFDHMGYLSMANKAGALFFGLNNSSIGSRLTDIFEISEEDTASFINALRSGSEENKLRLRSRYDGRMCLTVFTDMKDNYNESFCIFCFTYDLTKEEEMIEAVRKADEAKSAFLAHMSHEIRTPINVVLGMNEMILRESRDETIVKYASDINSAGQTLLALINDILDFSKIESGEMELVTGSYSMMSVLNDCYKMIIQRAENKGIRVEFRNDAEIPGRLIGDEIRIKQILTNLLTNAVKYTEKGSVTLEIMMDPGANEDEILITFRVSDTGIGISEEDKEKIFNAFKRADQKHNQSIEGTGLGLAITKQLTDLMGGMISVESEKGKGSVFTVTFEQIVEDRTGMGIFAPDAAVLPRLPGKFSADFTAPTATILAVDDVKMNLDVVVGLLKPYEINIETALSGQQCLKLTDEKKYDLILLDHMMPDMDGIETLQEMKKNNNINSDTPVIVLTANAINGVKDQYIKAGFSDYLSKPIRYEELERILLEYLPKESFLYGEKTDDISEPKDDETLRSPAALKQDLKNKLTFLNYDLGLEYSMDDEEFYREMIMSFINGDKTEQLEQLFSAENYKDYQINVHALKGTSLGIGADEFSAQAKALESAVKQGDIEYALKNHREFMESYSKLLTDLKNAVMQ